MHTPPCCCVLGSWRLNGRGLTTSDEMRGRWRFLNAPPLILNAPPLIGDANIEVRTRRVGSTSCQTANAAFKGPDSPQVETQGPWGNNGLSNRPRHY